MPTVTYTYAGPLGGSSALELLAKLQNTELVVNSTADAKPSLTVVTTNPIVGSSSTSTMDSWVSCAKALSNLIPSLSLWRDDDDFEQWISSAASILDGDSEQPLVDFVSQLETYLTKNSDKTYLMGEFSTADVCVSIWCASAMIKFDFVPENGKSSCDWIAKTLKALAPHNETVSKLLSDFQVGVASKLVGDLKVSDTQQSDSFPDNASVSKLREFGLEFEVYAHETCMTADELVEKVPLPSEKETHTKNLFFKDKKHGLFLVTHAVSSTFNTKQLGALLKLQGKVNMRLANTEALEKHLNVKPGCVGPLCIVNDIAKEVTLVMDKTLLDGSYDYIHSHPLRNDASVKMTPAVFEDFFKKAEIEPAVVDFSDKDASGTTQPAASGSGPSSKGKQKNPPKKQQKPKQNEKGKTKLALQYKKAENFAMWYSNVIVLSEMISYYDISGCYILRPWSYKIWDLMQQWFNEKILKLGVENCYFPLFVSQDRLEKEKDHVEGFAPEVAWVTKSGDSELAQQIAIRPTSETIMYPAFSDWIKSHRDLPLKLNQWSNVVRWEFKDPTPFLRSREFLWQEGHTAHATYEEADEMVMAALDLYKQAYQDLLCVPVIPGYKSQHEKFAGGHQTTTVEAYIPISGRAIQGATSHNLGQNFGKMFDIKFQDEKGESKIAWQTSWGLTTRTIGVMVMVHGDDKGLVMPPRVSPVQAVIVPILSKKLLLEDANSYCLSVLQSLESQGLRAKYDDRTMYNPGWKYNHWEQKGVPIRIEVGPMDIEKNQVRAVIRHNGEKIDLPVDGLGPYIESKLEEIQKAMFEKAAAERDAHVVKVTEWKDFVPNLEKNNLVLTPWCGPEHEDWEEWVKKTSREESLANLGQEEEDERAATSVAAKTLCVPFDQPELPSGTKCIASGMDATCWILWGRSY
uniref:proline--tRNA ligase n=1 Tax=Pseudo-nitzschia delicatissima TaxID=44447 RepID=A0A7S0TAC5_9STRA|mmetsp:Transcript_1195/g.2707  ORF Transcript_1195/g.2707 Transcript_1195/m.2707 type:complete len:915 (+) Transcript_1195:105-2849(+)